MNFTCQVGPKEYDYIKNFLENECNGVRSERYYVTIHNQEVISCYEPCCPVIFFNWEKWDFDILETIAHQKEFL